MKQFGIYSPVLGLRKDFPSAILDKSFTPDLQNVRFWNGEIITAKMRQKILLRKTFSCEESSGALTVSGDVTSYFPAGSFDLFIYDAVSGYSQVYDSTTAQVSCAYSAGTDLTTFTSDDPVTYPLDFPVGSSNTFLGLYTDDLETDPEQTGFLQVPVPDAGPVLRHHDLLSDSGDIYLFAFTAEHIYLWDSVTTQWLTAYTGSETTSWSSASLNGYLVVTNNIDVPMLWDGTVSADSFGGLGGDDGGSPTPTELGPAIDSGGSPVRINRAKFVIAFEGHLIFANYDLSDASSYPNQIIWSDLDDHTNWLQDSASSDAGSAYVAGDGIIDGGMGCKDDFLYVFKDRSARVFWYTGSDLVFNSRPYMTMTGSSSPDSIVNDADGNLYYYASDMTFREVDLGVISQPLGDETRSISQDLSLVRRIQSTFIPEYGEVWFAVPYGGSATGNNKIFSFKQGTWNVIDMAVSAFGHYRQSESYTWDTLPYSTWNEWDWPSWDAVDGVSGWPLDLCAGYDGKSYLSHSAYKDAGVSYESYFVLTTDLGDLSLLRYFKRLLAIQLFIQKVGDESITVYVKRDNETVWQEAGTVTVAEQTAEVLTERIPVDLRGKRFEIKVSSSSPFRFLGIEFDYNLSGVR